MKTSAFIVHSTLLVFLFCSCNGSKIYNTAYISKRGYSFIVTLRGLGVGHPAGPFDVISPKTFPDSMRYVIPRDEGLVVGEELPHDSCCYDATGKILIAGNHITIDLYFKNTDDKWLDTGIWNGQYDLVRVK